MATASGTVDNPASRDFAYTEKIRSSANAHPNASHLHPGALDVALDSQVIR